MSELSALARHWMPRCIELAERGAGKVSPNPMVGAVVLDRKGRLISEGFHKRAGGPHAEVNALTAAGNKARGGILIVSLEPCNHQGRTGPCSEAVLRAGIARVAYGAPDPIAAHAGGGRALRKAGIEVKSGVLRAECERSNRIFFSVARFGRPHVVAKAAATLDGMSATCSGESKWITSEKARAHGRKLRHNLDAICVGVGTVLADDPQLTARRRGSAEPLRIVVDSELRTPPTARLLPRQSVSGAPCLIATTRAAPVPREKKLVAAGADVVRLPGRRPSLTALLAELQRRELTSLLVEGGPTLLGSFFAADLVDELRLYQAGMVLGDGARSWLGGPSSKTLADARRFEIADAELIGADLAITALRRTR